MSASEPHGLRPRGEAVPARREAALARACAVAVTVSAPPARLCGTGAGWRCGGMPVNVPRSHAPGFGAAGRRRRRERCTCKRLPGGGAAGRYMMPDTLRGPNSLHGALLPYSRPSEHNPCYRTGPGFACGGPGASRPRPPCCTATRAGRIPLWLALRQTCSRRFRGGALLSAELCGHPSFPRRLTESVAELRDQHQTFDVRERLVERMRGGAR